MSTSLSFVRTLFAALAGAVMACAVPAAAQEHVRAIEQVSENVYRFQRDNHYGALLVTREGAVVVDPIDRETANWLKREVASRFKVPVTHVIYSHFHWDHAAGAGAFDQAKVISHRNTIKNLQQRTTDTAFSPYEVGMDTNGDGKLQRAETTDPEFAANFTKWDTDKDGALTGKELIEGEYSDVRVPDETYDGERHSLTVGGQTIELHHVNSDHADDTTYVVFPGNVLFIVDAISIKAFPYGTLLGGFNERELNVVANAALELNPGIVFSGHGSIGTADDIRGYRQYHYDLLTAVQAGIDAGQTLDQIKQSVTMDAYRDWSNTMWIPTNIEGMYAHLTANAARDAVTFRPDGSTLVGNLEVPIPTTISPEAAAYLKLHNAMADGPPSGPAISEADAEKLLFSRFPGTVEDKVLGGVPVRIVTPAKLAPNSKGKVLINLHGGGFMFGRRAIKEAAPIAALSGIPVVAVDYRLVPDHPYPAAVNDTIAVYRELLKQYRPDQMALYGSSAGAVLGAEATVKMRELGLPTPAALGFFSGSVDMARPGDTASMFGFLGFEKGVRPARAEARGYTAGANLKDPVLSPIYADLKGFPPTLLMSGTRDFFLSGTSNFHRALLHAGVEADLIVFDAMPHVHWDTPTFPEAFEALRMQADFLAGHLKP